MLIGKKEGTGRKFMVLTRFSIKKGEEENQLVYKYYGYYINICHSALWHPLLSVMLKHFTRGPSCSAPLDIYIISCLDFAVMELCMAALLAGKEHWENKDLSDTPY